MTPPDPLPVNEPNPKRNFQAETLTFELENTALKAKLDKISIEHTEYFFNAEALEREVKALQSKLTALEAHSLEKGLYVIELEKVKKYWQEQTDSLRPKLAASEAKLEAGKALHKDIKQLLDEDTLDHGLCRCQYCMGIKSALTAYEKATQ